MPRKTDAAPERSLSIEQFCELEGISRQTYYFLRRDGLAPQEYRLKRVVRITYAARLKWQAMMLKRATTRAAKLERQRYSKIASIAGRANAA